MDYWQMSFDKKKAEGLPKSFPLEVFMKFQEWYGILLCNLHIT